MRLVLSVMLAVLSIYLQQINNNHQYFRKHETSFHERKAFTHAGNVLILSQKTGGGKK